MKKLLLFFLISVFFISLIGAEQLGAPLPSGKAAVVENFEEGYVWVHAGEDWDRWGGSHSTVGAELWRKWRTEGKYSLHMIYGKNIDGAQSLWYMDYPENETLDISEYDFIAVDLYNPSDLGIVLGFCMQDCNWDWVQSDTWIWFPKGEHTLCYDIRNIDVEKRKNIRRLMFLMPTETTREGDLYIDNIRGYKN